MYYTNLLKVSAADANIRVLGRTAMKDGKLFISWSNSGFTFTCRADHITFFFDDYVCDQPCMVCVEIDGVRSKYALIGNAPKILLENLGDKKHVIALRRVSEGDLPLQYTGAQICGKAPALLTPPKEKKRKIEFIGDSITCGFGVLAPRTEPNFHTYEEDSMMTYAYMTAEALDAEIRMVAISGQGVVHNCAAERGIVFADIFEYGIRGESGHDHSTWQPDVFVLNCGTNDVPGQTTFEDMTNDGEKLVKRIREVYPDALIVWTYGMMNDKYKPTIKAIIAKLRKDGDKKLFFCPVDDIYGKKDEVGACGHPNVNASVRVSKILAAFIEKKLAEVR